MRRTEHLDTAFAPSSIAVIGVGPITAGRFYVESLLAAGYRGPLYPIHPDGGEISGLKILRSLKDVAGPVDFVESCIPARFVPQLIRECAEKHVKVVSMFTSGFSETGSEMGRQLEAEIVRVARDAGIRLIGPNCMGVYSPKAGVSFVPDFPRESGGVALVCQSGGNTIYLVRLAAERGIRFSKAISYGNACDVDEGDLFEYLMEDSETELVTAYIEGVKDGDRFRKVLNRLASRKPVVVLKGGVTREGARTASSHTSSLAGSDRVWGAILGQAGVIRVNTLYELVDMMVAFRFLRPPKGRRVAMVGGGGGASVLATDACASSGFGLPTIPAEVSGEMRSALDSDAGLILTNPIELNLSPEVTYKMTKTMLEYEGFDLMLANCVFGQHPWSPFDMWFDLFCDTVLKVHAEVNKPIAVAIESDLTNQEQHFAALKRRYVEARLPVYYSMSDACLAVDRFMRWREAQSARE
ncbi:MAG: CoA-binding protein [Dehalococcoidia bacterium]|nr:CoA-binding protein [Dehalococcoidia bacterium]